jgi:flagellar FliJ protein
MDPRFRLQPVLSYRQDREDALKLELAGLLSAEGAAREQLDALRAESLRAMDEVRALQVEARIDVGAIAQGFFYLDAVQAALDVQVQVLAEATRQVEAKRAQLLKAMQDRKILEKLKERYQRQYAEWVRRAEQRVADDNVTVRYNRRQIGVEEGIG